MGTRLKMQPANQDSIKLGQWGKPGWRSWLLLVVLLTSLLLSGCVHADLEINFRGQSGGEIIQHIKLADQLSAVNSSTTQDWFEGIKRRARQFQGKVKRSNQEIEVRIPFGTTADLEAKLNQFLPAEVKTSPELQLPLVQSHVRVRQQNFLLFLRNRLIYDLDLRSLGVQSISGNLLLSPDALLELEFKLNTPWGARSLTPSNADATSPKLRTEGQQLVWTLQPGQANHLEAIFWFPSFIGIGAGAIALLVAGGMYLKYGLLAKSSIKSALPRS